MTKKCNKWLILTTLALLACGGRSVIEASDIGESAVGTAASTSNFGGAVTTGGNVATAGAGTVTVRRLRA